MFDVREKQHTELNWSVGGDTKPRVDLIGDTLTTEIVLDLQATVDISGGSDSGTLTREQPLTLLPRIRIYDGSELIVDVSARALRQIGQRSAAQAYSGVQLANGGIATTTVREQLRILFSDPRTVNPIETALKARNPKNLFLEVEWAGATTAAMQAALVGGSFNRTVALTNTLVRVCQVHDPVAYARTAPIFIPRLRELTFAAPASNARFPAELKVSNRVRSVLLQTTDADVTTESIISALTFRDDRTIYVDQRDARSWHEREQALYGGAVDDASVAMGYFFHEFVQFGRLSGIWSPVQGANPKYELNVTGGASRIVRAFVTELEHVPGICAPIPDGF